MRGVRGNFSRRPWIYLGFWLALGLSGLGLGLGFGLGPVSAQAQPTVIDVRLGVHPDKTRLVLDLSARADYRVFLLAAPYRLVVDLEQARWQLPANTPLGGKGLVLALRYGQFDVDTTRMVLDLTSAAIIRQAALLPGNETAGARLVIDLASASDAEFQTALAAGPIGLQTAPPPVALPVGFPPPVKPALPNSGALPLIVIDAGHGGVDPGAIGRNGTQEKNVTLAMAQELARQLEASGRYRVHLTRDADIFLKLRDRIAIARNLRGDLFISLHADSHDNAATQGTSVYTLSENASDAEAEALAAKENKADLIAGVDLSAETEVVTSILIDLAQRETMNLSARFASYLVTEIGRDFKLLRNSHRFAGFAVLKAPDIPSVLVEMGYLSNAEDESRLAGETHRRKLAAALLRAIDGYFAWQASLQ